MITPLRHMMSDLDVSTFHLEQALTETSRAFVTYARHRPECVSVSGMDCSCGYLKKVRELAELVKVAQT
jgi:hypothetical protein